MSEQKPPPSLPPSIGHHTQPGQYHSVLPRTVGNPARSGAANQPPREQDGKFKKLRPSS